MGWGALVGHPGSREAMAPLVYPLVQVVLGACRLVPTPKYYPLRFHCAKILREISASTATFIPILSGSDDDFDDEENFKLKEERGKKRKNSGGSEEDYSESEEESPKRAKKSDEQDEE